MVLAFKIEKFIYRIVKTVLNQFKNFHCWFQIYKLIQNNGSFEIKIRFSKDGSLAILSSSILLLHWDNLEYSVPILDLFLQ